MRVATAADRRGVGRAFAIAAFGVHFVEGRALSEPRNVAAAAERAGLDGDVLLAEARDAEVKALLRERTDRALELGVTGVPSFVVDGEVFWGDDRLQEAAARV
jgi:2-hydroxychromene-2-carboxylate isomerase